MQFINLKTIKMVITHRKINLFNEDTIIALDNHADVIKKGIFSILI